MRTFVFGSYFGLFIAIFIGRKESTFNHPRYFSGYQSQALGLIGLCLIYCSMPFLCVAGLYRTSSEDTALLWLSPLNMWFALGAGILGSFTVSSLTYSQIFLHDIVFGGISVIIQ